MHRLIILLFLVSFLLVPTVVSAEDPEKNASNPDGTFRGLVLIIIGMQFPPLGYGLVKKSFELESEDDNDVSVSSLSKILNLGVILSILGILLIVGGLGHII